MAKYYTLLYYCYTIIEDPEQFAVDHLRFCKSLGLIGRVIVAGEGLNGTISGIELACRTYMDTIRADRRFVQTDFKMDEVAAPSFVKMHVRCKKELVHSGLDDITIMHPGAKRSTYLTPKEFLAMKDRDDVTILDVRSSYEHNLGKFKNAVTLDLEHFRDFPAKIDQLIAYKHKKILTYCTGGVRCEKASAFLLHKGFKAVYQLQGGIIKYSKETGGKDFEGKCYVFDKRLAIDVNNVNPTIISNCYNCAKPSTKMINCANPECNEHFIQCATCGAKMEGCCSVTCMQHPRRRVYDGTGYYVKQSQPSLG